MSFGRRRWRAARQAHHDAIYALARVALAIPEDRWLAPGVDGKWSPAQETLHVARAYEVAIDEIEVEFFGPSLLVERVCERAMACEEALERVDELRRGLRLSHPFFGPLRPLAALRLLTVHTAHHARQLQREAVAGRPTVA